MKSSHLLVEYILGTKDLSLFTAQIYFIHCSSCLLFYNSAVGNIVGVTTVWRKTILIISDDSILSPIMKFKNIKKK